MPDQRAGFTCDGYGGSVGVTRWALCSDPEATAKVERLARAAGVPPYSYLASLINDALSGVADPDESVSIGPASDGGE